jgi:phosphocarrier protein
LIETVSKNLVIQNKKGLHARASARFVQTVEEFDVAMTVTKDGINVGGTSIMGLMMLAASQGCTIAVSAKGADAKQAMDAIEALIEDKFGEGE